MVEKRNYLMRDGVVYFNDAVLTIDGYDFQRRNLMKAVLGQRVTFIGEQAFEGNYLRSITFYKKIKHIRSRAFANNQLEKIVFNRIEVPQIAKDAFENNPLKLILVPYESKDEYRKLLDNISLPDDVQIETNIEMFFKQAQEAIYEGSLVYICLKRVYGDFSWRIEVKDEVDFDSRMRRDQNEQNFSIHTASNGIEYHLHKDSRGNIQIYRKNEQGYVDMTFEDFKIIFEEKKDL